MIEVSKRVPKKRSTGKAKAVLDASWKDLYTAGSVSALLYIVLALVPIILVFAAPQPPMSDGPVLLKYIGEHKPIYIVELVSFVGLSLPAIVVFLALSVSLKHLNKSWAAIGAVVGAGSEIIALALGSSPPSLSSGLILLADQYATATETQGVDLTAAADGLIAAANAVSSAGILTALGILILSILMLKGVFRKTFAWVGIATGVIGMVFEALRPMLGMAYAIYGVLLLVWFIGVGMKLYGLGRGMS